MVKDEDNLKVPFMKEKNHPWITGAILTVEKMALERSVFTLSKHIKNVTQIMHEQGIISDWTL